MILAIDRAASLLHIDEHDIPCRIGRSGTVDAACKTEGDGATPIGRWPLRAIVLRPDRIALPDGLALPWRWIARDDGWSDDPRDPAYNRPVRHPHPFSAERLWRDDDLYDAIVLLGHNDAPAVAGRGSAIFLHCWRDGATTEGCVAIARDALIGLLPLLRPGDALVVT